MDGRELQAGVILRVSVPVGRHEPKGRRESVGRHGPMGWPCAYDQVWALARREPMGRCEPMGRHESKGSHGPMDRREPLAWREPM